MMMMVMVKIIITRPTFENIRTLDKGKGRSDRMDKKH